MNYLQDFASQEADVFKRVLRLTQGGKIVLYLVISLAALIQTAAYGADVSGSARIVDGDTIVVGDTRVRLEGIDAPETDQVCVDGKGGRWTCGVAARNQLAQHIGEHEVTCTNEGHDNYGRMLGLFLLGAKTSTDGW